MPSTPAPIPAPEPAPATPPHRTPFAMASPPELPTLFVYVRIPRPPRRGIDPLHLREHQLDAALRAQGIGSVVGWGDSLGARRADGARVATHIRIDILVSDVAAARTTLQALLPQLEAPLGTEIHYTLQGVPRHDRATPGGWLLEQPVPERAPPGPG